MVSGDRSTGVGASDGVPGGLEPVTIDAAWSSLTYLRGGEVGDPLVLLNALGQGLEPWSRLIPSLLPRRLLIWEMRGTSPPYRASTLADHVDDLAAILDHEGSGPCHLVGWCTGPKIALRYHLRGQRPVRSMVFLNGAFKHPGREPELDTAYERDLEVLCRAVDRRPGSATRLRQLFAPAVTGDAPAGAGGAGGGGAARPAALRAAVRRPFLSDGALVAYARQHLDFWADDPLPAAGGVPVPILFVAAERDEIVAPACVRQAAERFPAARYTEIGGASHYALFERADLVARLIGRFVGEHGPRRGLEGVRA